jgi:uncharacterized membrane protein (DUF4010 family)
MITLEFFPEWFIPLVIALITGLLIGLEQETPPHNNTRHISGIVTLPLIAIGGFVSAHWWPNQPIFLTGLAVMGLLVTAAFVRNSMMTGATGIAKEAATLLCWLLGGLVATGEWVAPLVIAIIATLILAAKKTERGETADKATIAKFILLALIVYLILPDQGFTELNINPRQVWSMMVLVSGIACIGYFVIQGFGPQRGLLVVAVLGGLVSSIAVTLAFARLSHHRPQLAPCLAGGIILAAMVMFMRQMVEIAAVQPALLPITAVLLLPALLTGLWLVWRNTSKTPAGVAKKIADTDASFSNPLELSTVIQFGALYGLIFALAQLAYNSFGPIGLYTFALLSGLFEVDAVTLALSQLNASNSMPTAVAVLGIAMATVSNLLVKAGLAWGSATRPVALQAVAGLATVMGIELVAIGTVLMMAWRAM